MLIELSKNILFFDYYLPKFLFNSLSLDFMDLFSFLQFLDKWNRTMYLNKWASFDYCMNLIIYFNKASIIQFQFSFSFSSQYPGAVSALGWSLKIGYPALMH